MVREISAAVINAAGEPTSIETLHLDDPHPGEVLRDTLVTVAGGVQVRRRCRSPSGIGCRRGRGVGSSAPQSGCDLCRVSGR